MKAVDILLTEDLIREYRLSRGFVQEHSVAMGGRGRPRKFVRSMVETYLERYHLERIREREEREREFQQTKREVRRIVARVIQQRAA